MSAWKLREWRELLPASRMGGLGRGDKKTGTEGLAKRRKTRGRGGNEVKGIKRQDYSYPRKEERHL